MIIIVNIVIIIIHLLGSLPSVPNITRVFLALCLLPPTKTLGFSWRPEMTHCWPFHTFRKREREGGAKPWLGVWSLTAGRAVSDITKGQFPKHEAGKKKNPIKPDLPSLTGFSPELLLQNAGGGVSAGHEAPQ